MKTFKLLGALALVTALSGCAALPLGLEIAGHLLPSASATGDKVVLNGTRALILAHNAFQGAAAGVAPLIRNRVLTSAQVDLVEDATNRAELLFATADGGKTEAQRAAEILNLADQLNKLAGK